MTAKLTMENCYIPFHLTWEDLTPDAQKRLLDALGIKSPKQAGFHTHVVETLNVGWQNDGLLERVYALNIDSWLISEEDFRYESEDDRGEEYWTFAADVAFPFDVKDNNKVPKFLEKHGVTDGLHLETDPESSCFYVYIYDRGDMDIFIERYNALVRKVWQYSDCTEGEE